jgi:hypothetical protein
MLSLTKSTGPQLLSRFGPLQPLLDLGPLGKWWDEAAVGSGASSTNEANGGAGWTFLDIGFSCAEIAKLQVQSHFSERPQLRKLFS